MTWSFLDGAILPHMELLWCITKTLHHGAVIKAKFRGVIDAAGSYTLREPAMPYRPIFERKSGLLMLNNTVFLGGNS